MALGVDIITIFPQVVLSYLQEGILRRASQRGLLDVRVYNLRDYSTDKHKTVDDYPYGGGPGMVMKVEPFYRAINDLKADGIERHVILTTPQGRVYDQQRAAQLAALKKRIVILCGRYEGIDERVRILLVNEELSIGDYVLMGGELAALVIVESVCRLIPGVLGDEDSAANDSFGDGLLDYPHYTRPPEFMGLKVPEVLLCGDHKKIEEWRKMESLKRTLRRRPDLIIRQMKRA
jgi:tRNA (guanine37-N1)-methyltransferase